MISSSGKFYHPYEPYGIQLDFMQKLYSCIENAHVGIFESPTGTGKSLSLICAALTWLRDDEKRQVIGNVDDESEIDWLAQAERKSRIRQLLDTRREVEEKLNAIRGKTDRQPTLKYSAKKAKVDDQLREQDLVLDDYESESEQKNGGTQDGEALSSATLALLDQLKPAKVSNEHGNDETRTQVIFCSRTHSQLSQFVSELRKVDIPSGIPEAEMEETVKHIPLGSRKNLCINPKVAKLSSTTAINERCMELQKPGIAADQKCTFLPLKASAEDRERLEAFKDSAIAHIQDIEDIAELGRKSKLCPYYASRSAIAAAEVLTLPYALLLQRSAREALGVNVRNNVIIIDEAHNLTSAIADTLSVQVPLSHLELAQKQLLGYCQKFRNRLKGKNRVYIAQIIRLMKSCILRVEQASTSKATETSLLGHELTSQSGNDQIQPHKLVKYIQESKLVYKVEGYAELLDQQDQTEQTLHSRKPAMQHNPKGVLAEFQALLIALLNPASEGRFFITRIEKETVLKYILLDPQAHFQEIVNEARTVILAGGTMSPMADWRDYLFPYVEEGKLEAYSFDHIIQKTSVLVQPLSQGPSNVEFDFTYSSKQSEEMVLEMSNVIEKLCVAAPDGMVVFFPSYDYLSFVTSMWKRGPGGQTPFQRINTRKRIFQESKEVNVDELLKDYGAAIACGEGALMLAVVGGKLSEGINFSDRLGRVVVCVGLPYPNINSEEWKAKLDYIKRMNFEKFKRDGLPEPDCKARAQAAGREYADNTTMRAVNQSIGRAIRHKNDYAAIYLLDKRYVTSRIQDKLPGWLKESIRPEQASWQDVEDSCRAFFADKL